MALIFDLDGTLTDSARGIVASLRYALTHLGVEPPSDDTLRGSVGPPLRDSFRSLLATDDAERIAMAVELYLERYEREGLFENLPYPEIPKVLEKLRRAGHELYVGTSKPRLMARRILDHFGLSHHFRAVFGAEPDGSRAHKAELLAHALEQTGLSAQASWMIGDRCHDVVGAKANGLRSVGVLWGYGSRDELESAGADRIVARPADLLHTLDD